MSDTLTKKQRSYCMSRIKSKNTKPELFFKRKFKNFIYHPNVFGNPDFINYPNKEVIFIDGCFWHKCPKHYTPPKSNRKYWLPKLEKNIIRDKEVGITYTNAGWKVTRIWEHELKN
jgi:DNA mismatch endonuclease (patch repair protein)